MDPSFINVVSEDELRTKIIYSWLKDCGFTDADITIEYSFDIQLGRKAKRIHPRSDILVRSANGNNLLVIEAKEPNHNLGSSDKEQAISYARMLVGGIAPFTILTNGTTSLIFDSITKEVIDGDFVPSRHPYVAAGFKVTSENLKARTEALEYLVSLSSDNLQAFCEGQVEYSLRLLKGEHIYSNKKYIPTLYIGRCRLPRFSLI